jgi:hypothetical protein
MSVSVKDCQLILPCVDELWRTRTADWWSVVSSTVEAQQTHSLRDLFTSLRSTAPAFLILEFAKICQHLMLFVEERQGITASESWFLNDFRSDDQHEPMCATITVQQPDWRYQMLVPSEPLASPSDKGVWT